MIKTIGFRRLLPIANCLLYVVLTCFGSCRITSAQFDPSTLILAVNVPVVLAAFTLDAAVFHSQLKLAFLLSIPLVPLLWYLVGSWIDRRIGWIPSRKYVRTLSRDVLLASAVVTACLVVVVFVQTVTLVHPPRMSWVVCAVCAWMAFLLAVLGRMVYRRLVNAGAAIPAESGISTH
jgi:hypothetical protein